MKIKTALSLITAMFFLLVCTGNALAFNHIITFGDSLSDDGPKPTDQYLGIQHFTNDKVWVEYLADRMGATLTDYAFGGANTNHYNLIAAQNAADAGAPPEQIEFLYNTGLQSQLAWLPDGDYDDTLFTVWAGANDFFVNASTGDMTYNPCHAAANVGATVKSLIDLGAENIVVPNLPDFALTPKFAGITEATHWAVLFNTQLNITLDILALIYDDVNIFEIDTFGLLTQMYESGEFENVTGQWLVETGGDQSLADKYLFWDGVHPMSGAHQKLAENVLDTISHSSSVPEPATCLLIGTALAGVAGLQRRRLK